EHTVAPLNHIEINLKDPTLGHDRFDHYRNHRLLRLAPPCAFARQEQILRQLLTDRGTARYDLSLLDIFFVRFLDAVPVEAFMIEKLRILGGDNGTLQTASNPFVRYPLVLQYHSRL